MKSGHFLTGCKTLMKPWAFVDAHCHLDLYENPLEVLQRAEKNKTLVVAVTNAPSVFFYTQNLAKKHTFIKAAVGLHPELVHLKGSEINQMWDYLDDTRFVGEIGLDYSSNNLSHKAKQRAIFGTILDRCSTYGNKILTIHSRNASEDVVNAIGGNFPGKVILHWYSGRITDLEKAVSHGMYFSVNNRMVTSKRGQELVKRIPITRIVTETDGPFTQARRHKRPSEPVDVIETIHILAEIWCVLPVEAQKIVQQNLSDIIGPESFNDFD